jgi:fructokinase
MSTGAPFVMCMGEILIDFLAEPKGKGLIGAKAFRPNPGGAPANVAVGLARLGVPAGFIGMVGDDDFGTLLRETLTNENVDTRSLATSTEQPTTLAFVALDPSGVPSFVFYRHPGADLSIRPDDVDWSVFDHASVFHCGSLSLVDDPARETTHACLKHAKERGIAVSYDPNYRPALWPDKDLARARMLEPLEYVTIFKASADELRMMSGEDDVETGCAALADQGPKIIVVTEGSSGMFLWSGGQTADVAGEKVEVVDTTGCGDASVAGLLTYVVDYQQRENALPPFKELERALTFANHCAAIAATKPGAIPSLPKRADVQHLLPDQT